MINEFPTVRSNTLSKNIDEIPTLPLYNFLENNC